MGKRKATYRLATKKELAQYGLPQSIPLDLLNQLGKKYSKRGLSMKRYQKILSNRGLLKKKKGSGLGLQYRKKPKHRIHGGDIEAPADETQIQEEPQPVEDPQAELQPQEEEEQPEQSSNLLHAGVAVASAINPEVAEAHEAIQGVYSELPGGSGDVLSDLNSGLSNIGNMFKSLFGQGTPPGIPPYWWSGALPEDCKELVGVYLIRLAFANKHAAQSIGGFNKDVTDALKMINYQQLPAFWRVRNIIKSGLVNDLLGMPFGPPPSDDIATKVAIHLTS
jgi:hypothetical protein